MVNKLLKIFFLRDFLSSAHRAEQLKSFSLPSYYLFSTSFLFTSHPQSTCVCIISARLAGITPFLYHFYPTSIPSSLLFPNYFNLLHLEVNMLCIFYTFLLARLSFCSRCAPSSSRIIEKLRHLLIFNFFLLCSPDTFDITLCGIVFLLLMVGNGFSFFCLFACQWHI